MHIKVLNAAKHFPLFLLKIFFLLLKSQTKYREAVNITAQQPQQFRIIYLLAYLQVPVFDCLICLNFLSLLQSKI